jgi:hypothetical protein
LFERQGVLLKGNLVEDRLEGLLHLVVLLLLCLPEASDCRRGAEKLVYGVVDDGAGLTGAEDRAVDTCGPKLVSTVIKRVALPIKGMGLTPYASQMLLLLLDN